MNRLVSIARLVTLARPVHARAISSSLPRFATPTTPAMAINITADGGITKEITREGTGGSPTPGSHVTAHYTGTFPETGAVFDSSVKRGRPFQFQIGIGQVIKGWDLAFASMRKGEKAIITCRPEYAYGRAGAGGVIPPNATLKFEVELIDFM